jgi:ferredoxin
MSDQFLDIGTIVSIQKSELDNLFAQLKGTGYQLIGPKAIDHSIIHAPITFASELPQGYSSVQEAGKYQLIADDHHNYFDYVTGSHSWKPYFFPSKVEIMKFQKQNSATNNWEIEDLDRETPSYALLGVRPCDLAAIDIQDKIFLRDGWCDQFYLNRREKAFIIAVNCMQSAGNCFCTSFGTGPKAKNGFDLCLTELDNTFLVEIGSEAGRKVLNRQFVISTPASAFSLNSAQKGLDVVRAKITRQLHNPMDLKNQLLSSLEHPEWRAVAERCLSCASCTQVCPTCFCWEQQDQTLLPSDTVVRVRLWDSCFNPNFSYVAHGNTRPNTRARYRQWLTHKFASWYSQFESAGCTGCGRCITWCPAAIDHIEEIGKIRAGEPS